MDDSKRVPFSSYMDKEIANRLDKLHRETMIPKSRLIDKALKLLFEEYKNK